MKKILTAILLVVSSLAVAGDTLHYITFSNRKGKEIKQVVLNYSSTDTLDEWTENILKVARSYKGTKVKPGRCGDYICKIIEDVKGVTKAESRFWRDYIDEVKLREIRPGDFVYYDKAELVGRNELVHNHIAVIVTIKNGEVWILEQNVGGSPVQYGKTQIVPLSGKIEFYRIKK